MRKLLATLFVAFLTNNSFAYYQAQQGRWLSRDPIVERGGINLYVHTQNQPINYIDILGKELWAGETTGAGGGSAGLTLSVQDFVLTGPCKEIEKCKCEQESVEVRVILGGLDSGIGISIMDEIDVGAGDWSFVAVDMPDGSSAEDFGGDAVLFSGPSLSWGFAGIDTVEYQEIGAGVVDQDLTEQLNAVGGGHSAGTGIGFSFVSVTSGKSIVRKKWSTSCDCP